MRRFLDGDFVRSLTSTSHQATAEALAEAVESPEGVDVFGEGAEVLATWDSHVLVSSGDNMYRAEWIGSGSEDGRIEFSSVESVRVPSKASTALASEAVEASTKAVEAMIDGDENFIDFVEEIFDLRQEGIPITSGEFLRQVTEWTGCDIRFRGVVGAVGEAVPAREALLREAADTLRGSTSQALNEADSQMAEVLSEAMETAEIAADIMSAARSLGVEQEAGQILAGVGSDILAASEFSAAALGEQK